MSLSKTYQVSNDYVCYSFSNFNQDRNLTFLVVKRCFFTQISIKATKITAWSHLQSSTLWKPSRDKWSNKSQSLVHAFYHIFRPQIHPQGRHFTTINALFLRDNLPVNSPTKTTVEVQTKRSPIRSKLWSVDILASNFNARFLSKRRICPPSNSTHVN